MTEASESMVKKVINRRFRSGNMSSDKMALQILTIKWTRFISIMMLISASVSTIIASTGEILRKSLTGINKEHHRFQRI